MPASKDDLSEREVEILRLVATGASNKEIAQALFISTNTVKVHLRNIFAKLGVTSRTEAALYAINSGLVSGVAGSEIMPSQPGMDEVDLAPSLELTGLAIESAPENLRRSARFRYILVGIGALALMLILAWFGYRAWRGEPAPQTSAAPLVEAKRWQSLAPMLTPRYALAVASYDQYIYAIGGRSNGAVTGINERYDLHTNSWDQMALKPLPVGDASAVVLGGKIFVPGGQLETGEVTAQMEIYDPRQDAWSSGAALPEALSAYALAAFEGKIYLFGGWNGNAYVRSVYEYDPGQDEWSRLDDMPTARGFAGAAAAAGKLFVLGGKNESGALAVCETYLPGSEGDANAWSAAPDMPQARYAMGVASVADILYVLGGEAERAENLAPIQFLPSMNAWMEFDSPDAYPVSFPGATSLEAYIYLIGGAIEGQASVQNQAYQAIFTISVPIIR